MVINKQNPLFHKALSQGSPEDFLLVAIWIYRSIAGKIAATIAWSGLQG
jgi:hypothetical protein